MYTVGTRAEDHVTIDRFHESKVHHDFELQSNAAMVWIMQISKFSKTPTTHPLKNMLTIRSAKPADFEKIWPIFHEIVSAGETYTYPRDTNKEQGFQLWMTLPRQTFVAEDNGEILGTYFIKTNQSGGGDHVCNCGYMVSSKARGRGLASLMCTHSQSIAKELGYLAMQFNFVVSTNEGAVRLWTQLGFDAVGRLPKAFHHPVHGLVDALVMFKWLDN